MIIKLILAIAIIIAAFSFINKLKKAPPSERRGWIIKGIIAVVVITLVVGAMTGRVPPAAGLVAIGAALAKFGLRWGLPLAKLWFAKTGGNATFRSEYLVMTVNVSGTAISGQVIKGEFADRNLENLSDDELQQLQAFFSQNDKKSYYLLAAYIRSRGFTQQHHEQPHQNSPPTSDQTPLAEAMEIMGFKSMPTKKEVISAHRHLMSRLHPDKGGNDYLAAKINAARDTLLNAIEQQ